MTKEEAIEVYYGLINPKIKEAFEFFVPELCESKDERIRKKCIELIKRVIPSGDSHSQESEEILDCIAYLERQKDVWKERAQNITANMLEDKIEGIQRELIEFLSNTVNASWVDIIQSADAYAERIRNIIEKQKEQKPILEVFGFKVGDAVRLKDGDGRKHIIKSFEEVEGVHGPNFYRVEFEDDSARDGIYPGEEYPNGYYTQMEKIEEEQKPAENNVIIPQFNVGDYIKSKTYNEEHLIKDINKNGYVLDIDMVIPFKDEDMWEVVEQKPIKWSKEEKDKLNSIERLIVNANAHGNSLIGDKEAIELQYFIHSLVKPVTNIAEWSEEDESRLDDIEKAISITYDLIHAPQYHNWLEQKLKSLRSQPKQDVLPSLSEKEIIFLKRTLDYLHKEHNRYGGKDFTNEIAVLEWLITHPILVSDTHWKPSEEQLIALRYYLNHVPYSLHKEHLSSLRDDCEKLFIQ